MNDYPEDPLYTDFDDEAFDGRSYGPGEDGYPDPDSVDSALGAVPTPDGLPDQPTPPRGTRRVPPSHVEPTSTRSSPVGPVRRAAPDRRNAPQQATPTRNAPRAGRSGKSDRDAPQTGQRYTSYYPPDPNVNAYPPGAPARRRKARRESGMYLPWWSLIVMLVAVGGLALGSLLVVNSLGGQAAPGGSTPIIVVITSTFTVGPPASPTGIPQKPTLTPTRPLPTIASTATLPAGNVAIGAQVQIVGVGGSGLNVRSGPGKQFTAKFLAQEGQVFVIKDGPQFASDEEWYYIEDPTNANVGGWASRRFLQGK